MSHPTPDEYYIPEPSPWPLAASLAVLLLVLGLALVLNDVDPGWAVLAAGLLVLAWMFYGWFGDVVRENLAGRHSPRVDRSFRLGMYWFIASEVFFFLTFFGALYYVRNIAVAWLGGAGYLGITHEILYNQFQAQWPTSGPGELGGPFEPVGAVGVPAFNTLVLLSSGATITWAHWGLKAERRGQLVWGLAATIALGLLFVALQAWEYHEAWREMNVTLRSGIYGSTFYLLTGFHGMHVTVGAVMLMAILGRALRGHFTPQNHFAFEAVAWYWHFVDVVWLALFIFVYWL
ncbi:cytochrome c oxidase subunit 3 [Inmirania thermothiophila]|uniref:cytochrome-c oxidase n=1 Tax=Inmirania thermothiophila TaxID=1750597 RepID=A0A3N1Y2L3_9GAMM|nr:cytochrome c oxidase subunit 3 [Inmirania thermothiophila]ROR32781.1 cytochrome c oxidase subunit 3 [Inmirania thermothiophila]